jgi:hypothetical protein
MWRIAGATAIETAEVPASTAKKSDAIVRARTLLLKSIILNFPSFHLRERPRLGNRCFPKFEITPGFDDWGLPQTADCQNDCAAG